MKKKKAAGIAIGVLLAAVVVVFGATQLKLCKVKSSDVQLEDIYQTDEHHFVIRYQIPEDCSPADAYSTSDQIHLDRKGDIAELSFSYKRPFIKKAGKVDCTGTVTVDQKVTSILWNGGEVWAVAEQSLVPAYLTDGETENILAEEETDDFVEHIYASGNYVRWDFDGNVLSQGGCDLEFSFASGKGTIQWNKEGIDADQISNIYIISKNNAEVLNYDSVAFKKGDALKLETADTCMLYVVAKDSQNVDWAAHVKVEEE